MKRFKSKSDVKEFIDKEMENQPFDLENYFFMSREIWFKIAKKLLQLDKELNITDKDAIRYKNSLDGKDSIQLKDDLTTLYKSKITFDDRLHIPADNITKIVGWEQEPFLQVHLLFLLHEYLRYIYREKLKSKTKSDIKHNKQFIDFVLQEISTTVNAYILLSYCKTIDFKNLDESLIKVKAASKAILEYTHSESMLNGEELVFPCGVDKTHALYISLKKLSKKTYELRVDNAGSGSESPQFGHGSVPLPRAAGEGTSHQNVVVSFIQWQIQFTNDEQFLEIISDYLTLIYSIYNEKITLEDRSNIQLIANKIGELQKPDKITDRLEKSQETWKLQRYTNDYPSYPKQQAHNCVTHGFSMSTRMRLVGAIVEKDSFSKEEKIFKYLTIREISFANKIRNSKSVYLSYFPNTIEIAKEKERIPKASFNETSLKRNLIEFYKKYTTIHLPVFDVAQPVSDTYIRLALVEPNSIETTQKAPLHTGVKEMSLESAVAELKQNRLRTFEDVFPLKLSKEVNIIELFEDTNRVVVVGRAGIGKSTFCKWVLDKWTCEEYWQSFTTVHWVSLRRLSGYKWKRKEDGSGISNADIAQFISYTIQQIREDRNEKVPSVDEICASLDDETQKTLFLLDGFDEVIDLVRNDKDKSELLIEGLLKQKYYLLTSRPHAILPGEKLLDTISISKENYYELLGFKDPDIPAYINKVFDLKSKKEKEFSEKSEGYLKALLKLLQNNPCLWDITHTPINLALLCAVWKPGLFADAKYVTMTQLYKILISRLYEINIEILAKSNSQDFSVKDYENEELEELYHPVQIYFEELALSGMLDNRAVFSEEFLLEFVKKNEENLKTFFEQFEADSSKRKYTRRVLLQKLSRVGFWNVSYLISKENTKEIFQCEFLHLTFQEWFAANALVDWFISEKFGKNDFKKQYKYKNRDYLNSSELLKELSKYQRFEITLWFFSGILSTKPNGEDLLEEFFSIILPDKLNDENPRLLFLATRCLEESNMPEVSKKNLLLEWYRLFSIKSLLIVERPKFYMPYRMLTIYYLKLSPNIQSDIKILPSLEKLAAKGLSNFSHIQDWAKLALSELSANSEIELLAKIINQMLQDENCESAILCAAIEHISERYQYQDHDLVTQCLLLAIRNSKISVRKIAAEKLIFLKIQVELAELTLTKIKIIENENRAIEQIKPEELMPSSAFSQLMTRDSEEIGERNTLSAPEIAYVRITNKKQRLVENLIPSTKSITQNEALPYKKAVDSIVLSDEIQLQIKKLCSDSECNNQETAQNLLDLAIETKQIAENFSSTDSKLGKKAEKVLLEQGRVKEYDEALVKNLASDDNRLCQEAAGILLERNLEVEKSLEVLVKNLVSSDDELCQEAAEILLKHNLETEKTLKALVNYLVSSNARLRQKAAKILLEYNTEVKIVIKVLVKNLTSIDYELRHEAAKTLLERNVEIEKATKALTKDLSYFDKKFSDNFCREIRQKAAKLLLERGRVKEYEEALVKNLLLNDDEFFQEIAKLLLEQGLVKKYDKAKKLASDDNRIRQKATEIRLERGRMKKYEIALVENLISDRYKLRQEAAQALLECNLEVENAIKALVKNMLSDQPTIRQKAGKLLLERGRVKEYVEALVKNLSSDDNGIRQEASKALLKEGRIKEYEEALVKNLTFDNDELRHESAKILLKQNVYVEKVLEALVKNLISSKPELRQEAAQVLLERNVEVDKATKVLVKNMVSDKYSIRRDAAKTLLKHGQIREYEAALVKKLASSNFTCREEGAKALLEGDRVKEYKEALQKNLSSSNDKIRQEAKIKLLELDSQTDVAMQTTTSNLFSSDEKPKQITNAIHQSNNPNVFFENAKRDTLLVLEAKRKAVSISSKKQ